MVQKSGEKTTWAAMKTTHVLSSSKGVNVWCLRES